MTNTNQSRRKSSTDLLTAPRLLLSRRSQSPSKMLHITELWASLSKDGLDYHAMEDDINEGNDNLLYSGGSVRTEKHSISPTNLIEYENGIIIQSAFNSNFSLSCNKNLTPATPSRNRQRRSSFSLLFPTKGTNDLDPKDNREDQIRDLCLKLKEFVSTVSSNSNYFTIDAENGFLPALPESNLPKLQVSTTKEIYQQQSAIWELLVTELNFLKQIQFIVQVYVLGFEIVRQEFFPKISSEEIFSNLKEVSQVSLDFWKQCMQPVIENYEATKQIFRPQLLKNGFIKIGDILEPYILYCTEISQCRISISKLEKTNELFAVYMKWAMNLEESNREVLCDHLAKPFLRLTKYKILLQAIQKYSDVNEKSEMQEMIDSVDTFVSRVNEKIEQTTLMKALHNINFHIDTYDVIEPLGDDLTPIISQYSKFDLTTPIQVGKERIIRQSIFQGLVKMREGSSKTVDVNLFLFTDVLLITKFKKKTLGKLKIIKPPIFLDTILVKKQNSNSFICIYLNMFNCISALYHFSSGDQKNVDKWIQKIEESAQSYSTLKATNICTDCENLIPELQVVHSSPKHELGRFRTHSNSESLENDLHEFSFKRKAPVTKKHKNKKDSYSSKYKTISTETPQRKGSNPTSKPSGVFTVNKYHKLYKSNSFVDENDKSKTVKHVSDCSDIDEPQSAYRSCESSPRSGIQSQDIVKQTITSVDIAGSGGVQIKDTRISSVSSDKNSQALKRNQSDSSPKIERKLNRKLSISLNKLNI